MKRTLIYKTSYHFGFILRNMTRNFFLKSHCSSFLPSVQSTHTTTMSEVKSISWAEADEVRRPSWDDSPAGVPPRKPSPFRKPSPMELQIERYKLIEKRKSFMKARSQLAISTNITTSMQPNKQTRRASMMEENEMGCIWNLDTRLDHLDPNHGLDSTDGLDSTHGIDSTDGLDPTRGIDSTHGIDSTDGLDSTHEVEPTHAIDSIDGLDSTHELDPAHGLDFSVTFITLSFEIVFRIP